MSETVYFRDKIAECLRLLNASEDPLNRAVYQAMADEFAAKLAALQPSIVLPDDLASIDMVLAGESAAPPGGTYRRDKLPSLGAMA